MERLTFVTEEGEVLFHPEDLPDDEGVTITQLAVAKRFRALETIAERLANMEHAEEQGLLLRLPCKVGTIIYKIENNTDACCKCNDFKISHCDDDLCGNKNGHDEGGVFYVLNPQYADKPLCKKQFYEIKEYKMKTIDEIFWLRNDFCKTVFLTGEEAEAKLKEMDGAE